MALRIRPSTSTLYAGAQSEVRKAPLISSVEDRRVAKRFVRSDIGSRRLVLVRPSSRVLWEVSMQRAGKPHSFADRRLAISYAKMWAAANPPSSVRVLSSTGSVDREWTYS